MKTICGESISIKQNSLSKAAKILSSFVSSENGASQVITAYLHRASTSFNELNQLHKERKSSHSHQKHNRHRTQNADQDDEKSSEEVNMVRKRKNELMEGRVKYRSGDPSKRMKRKHEGNH